MYLDICFLKSLVYRLKLLDVKALTRLADLYGDGKPAPRPLI